MRDYYFIDADHITNYEKLVEMWPAAKEELEYDIPCFITAIPMVYKKVGKYLDDHKNPVDWIWRWEVKYTLPKKDEYWRRKSEENPIPETPYDLTGSMVHLGRFALDMWGGYEHFNLRKCIDSLDRKHSKVLVSAIAVAANVELDTVNS